MGARFINKFPSAEKVIMSRTESLLSTAANEVYRLSQMEVPYDTGKLQQSSTGARRESQNKYTVSYGNSNVPYARRIHYGDREGMVFKTPGTKARYLEDPADRVARNIPQIARRIFGR